MVIFHGKMLVHQRVNSRDDSDVSKHRYGKSMASRASRSDNLLGRWVLHSYVHVYRRVNNLNNSTPGYPEFYGTFLVFVASITHSFSSTIPIYFHYSLLQSRFLCLFNHKSCRLNHNSLAATSPIVMVHMLGG